MHSFSPFSSTALPSRNLCNFLGPAEEIEAREVKRPKEVPQQGVVKLGFEPVSCTRIDGVHTGDMRKARSDSPSLSTGTGQGSRGGTERRKRRKNGQGPPALGSGGIPSGGPSLCEDARNKNHTQVLSEEGSVWTSLCHLPVVRSIL